MDIFGNGSVEYDNGTHLVRIFDDGTKNRHYDNPSGGKILYPESMDLKITNYCNMGCRYCHEESDTMGVHADIMPIIENLTGLPKGVEIAIGGGNPLDHPDLDILLEAFNDMGLIANITVNSSHLNRIEQHKFLLDLIQKKLINGIGVSVNKGDASHNLANYTHTVAHVIAGVHQFNHIRSSLMKYNKILILGYKEYGRGVAYRSPKVDKNIHILKNNLWLLFDRNITDSGIISFDNLALQQLDVERNLHWAEYSDFFMGADGTHTMYYDAVKKAYAKSSTSPKYFISEGETVIDYFRNVIGSNLD